MYSLTKTGPLRPWPGGRDQSLPPLIEDPEGGGAWWWRATLGGQADLPSGGGVAVAGGGRGWACHCQAPALQKS